ncbi:MAG: superoxide dismutase [Fe-Zn] 1 [Lysobacteraceae bacterium]|nr:MAG: superoxide dismutase [Fe-Zn] 1 [Xanthomonadaceae bacterium]
MANSPYTLPSLPYGLADLAPAYSEELLELHYSKHHQAYVNGANATLQKLADARADNAYEHINGLQKNLAFHLSGHVLHSLFWQSMTAQGGGEPSAVLQAQIKADFGSVDDLRNQVAAAAKGLQGSGWVCLSWDGLSEKLIVQQIQDHQSNAAHGAQSILALDMWEHAYYLQYQNAKAKWIEAYWDLADWAGAEDRLKLLKG